MSNKYPSKQEVTLINYGTFLNFIILLLTGVFWFIDEEMLIVYGTMGWVVSGLFIWINFQILKRKYPEIIFQNIGEIFRGQKITTFTKEQIKNIEKQKKIERNEDFNYYLTLILLIIPLVFGFFGYISYGLPNVQIGVSTSQYIEMVGMGKIFLMYGIRSLICYLPSIVSIFRKNENSKLIVFLCGLTLMLFVFRLDLSFTFGMGPTLVLIIISYISSWLLLFKK
tara:strand:+ start:56 stop:730 length:675 start_codon:yes stop_codon:yes gene_type:complete